jgi:hypothetical protein
MLIQAIKEISYSRRDVRKTGFAVGVVLGLLGCFLWWHGSAYYSYFLIASVALLALSVVAPTILKPFHCVWMTVAVVLGWIMTGVILTLFYYLVFTPIALIARLLGRNVLKMKFEKSASTYWVPKVDVELSKDHYERQF